MGTIRLGTAKADSGEKAWGQLHVREGGKRVRLPVCVINGARTGEHVVVVANQHGTEVNGVESARRFAEETDPRKLKGTVFVIPSANPRAAMIQHYGWPEDEKAMRKHAVSSDLGPDAGRHADPFNMNRKWPGDKGGLLVERMVYELWNRAVMAPHRKASLFIDLHGHFRPESYVYARTSGQVGLAVATGIQRVIMSHSGGKPGPKRGITNAACEAEGIASLTFELGGKMTMSPASVECGRRGIVNMLKFWGMLPGRPQYPEYTLVMDPWRDDVEKREFARPSRMECVAKRRGLVFPYVGGNDWIRKGDLVCHVTDPFTGRIVQEGRAPMTGALYAEFWLKAPCEKGDRLFVISLAKRTPTAEFMKRQSAEQYR